MKAAQWKKINTLFKEIVDLDPEQRSERLKTVKTNDPITYEELITLLKADFDQTSLLDGFAIEHVDLSDLFPLEGVIALIVGFTCAAAGALLGSLTTRYLPTRSLGEKS